MLPWGDVTNIDFREGSSPTTTPMPIYAHNERERRTWLARQFPVLIIPIKSEMSPHFYTTHITKKSCGQFKHEMYFFLSALLDWSWHGKEPLPAQSGDTFTPQKSHCQLIRGHIHTTRNTQTLSVTSNFSCWTHLNYFLEDFSISLADIHGPTSFATIL